LSKEAAQAIEEKSATEKYSYSPWTIAFEFVLVSAAAKPSKNFLQLTMRTSVTTVFSRGDADAIGGMRLRQFD